MAFLPVSRACLASIAATLMVAPIAHALGIGLQPTSVEMDAEPGTRQRQVISIANVNPEKTMSLTLGLADWTLDRDGQIQLAPPGEREESASEWARFSPAFVTLKPGETQQVIVDIITPPRLERSGDFRFALLASTILPDTRTRQSGVWRKYEVATLFYLTADPAMSEPAVRDARLSISPNGKQVIDLMIENTGNAHARLEGNVLIEGDGDSVSIPISNLVVLDGGEREFQARVPGDLPGKPKVTVSFENIFAPQASGGVMPIKTYTAPLTISGASVGSGSDVYRD
ncbi:hypothetical protein WNY37_12765 [Henriciella sp. AS95]|uniref:hypothetical protein n=1 Tax=Henriciella sp. AS95 TaxID=3135782 RepID=UPI00317E14F5